MATKIIKTEYQAVINYTPSDSSVTFTFNSKFDMMSWIGKVSEWYAYFSLKLYRVDFTLADSGLITSASTQLTMGDL